MFLTSMVGCATAQFVANGPINVSGSPKTPDEVLLFYDVKDIPFKYDEIGRIYMDIARHQNPQPHQQIKAIRKAAAARGADAVIIHTPREESKASGGAYADRQIGMASSHGYVGYRYEGIAIVKKP
jgi:hypothetical protein